ncbi:MAG TPA: lipopolysaccharide kinase InaA family protein [Gemmataceae bacterium]|jgi:tRNA A-37 threonylcarbamoyl transferase component Bud32|nr:lipopolysaccharide kinase InaA family protein [Gemmataceae bacterium]
MAFVDINPFYKLLLKQHGLTAAGHFLDLQGVIVSGHPDRHVARVTLGTDPSAVRAFLKREHRVRWRDRLANAWLGFGFVAKSHREGVMLCELRRAGVGCPEWIAAGQDRLGRAFLLVRELEGAVELRAFLRCQQEAPAAERLRFARRLGRALGRLHNAGFDHPDLYSKHVLVHSDSQAVSFLDWQRCLQRRRLTWRKRARGLAALDASLADDLAGTKERLACLHAYWRESVHGARVFAAARATAIPAPRSFLRRIRRQAARLLRRPRIRELRHAPLPAGVQNLIWLDGEAMCVTREFQDEMGSRLPHWLATTAPAHAAADHLTETPVRLPGARQGTLVRRRASWPWRWLWCLLRRRPLTTPELLQAGTLFRLQRHGIGTPRLLAVGQRTTALARTESFLLTERPADCTSLRAWLTCPSGHAPAARAHVLRATADVLRRLHESNHYIIAGQADGSCPLLVQACGGGAPAVALSSVARIHRRPRPSRPRARRDLAAADDLLCQAACSSSERLRFLLHYHRLARLTPALKGCIRSSGIL